MDNDFLLECGQNRLEFVVEEDNVYLCSVGNTALHYPHTNKFKHAYIAVFDADQPGDRGNRYVRIGEELRYVSHVISHKENTSCIEITEENERLRVTTVYTLFDKCAVFTVRRYIRNIFDSDVCLEQCSAFMGYGVLPDAANGFIYKPHNSNFGECGWSKSSLLSEGLYELDSGYAGAKKTETYNRGSQSSKEYLPMGILECDDRCFMWEIESDNLWHFESGINAGALYVNISGGAYASSGWLKTLKGGQTYVTPTVRCVFGNDIENAVTEMTTARRSLRAVPLKAIDAVIYNEFMHYAWSDAREDRTREAVQKIAPFGVDYYVIDACWHDETCPTNPTHIIGNWQESKTRFPGGLKTTLDAVRAAGCKVGLWVEVQSVGIYCDPLPLPDDAFFSFRGKKTVHNRRYHVDFRHPASIAWADKVIEKIVREYEVDYIKIDYNQFSYGTDIKTDNMAAALEEHGKRYIEWLRKQTRLYPHVVFEACASGGQSINPLQLGICDLMSTSDCQSHAGYAYIAANICSAILPEQAAVWCYPADTYHKTEEITDGDVQINMVNGMLYRIHLASPFFKLPQSRISLIKEGLAYYRKLSQMGRENFYPVFPCGFAEFGNPVVVGGVRCGNRLFLSVYKLCDGNKEVKISLARYGSGVAKIGYPIKDASRLSQKDGNICITFDKSKSAVIVEYELTDNKR